MRLFRAYGKEAKARKLLDRGTFRHAGQGPTIPNYRRRVLAREILDNGAGVSRERLTALGQAKIAYCDRTLQICGAYGCVAFASIVPRGLERPSGTFLRKDYSFLFERFYHFLNSHPQPPMGIVVFDELEKTQSHILLRQMEDYFLRTKMGQTRSRLIIPEPLFVHSDLTTMVQMADIVAYVLSWGVRLRYMTSPRRAELSPLGGRVLDLRYHHATPGGREVWGFKVIQSLFLSGNSS